MSEFTDKLASYGADVSGAMERFLDDEELFSMCLDSFFEDAGFSGLQNAFAAGDVAEAFEHAHSLKGVAGNLGLTPLFEKISAVVEVLRAGQLPEAAAVQAIMDDLSGLKKIMQA